MSTSPFEIDSASTFLACVGDNGGTDNDQICRGFCENVQLIFLKMKEKGYGEDTLVYPLVYSSRHSMELSLKIIIFEIEKIFELKGTQKSINYNLRTHDLLELDKIVDSLLTKLPNLNISYQSLKSYLQPFQFDKEGDAFKYDSKVDGSSHMKSNSITSISLDLLVKNHEDYFQHHDNFLDEVTFLQRELQRGTFTRNLTRTDIIKISMECPNYQDWDTELKGFKEKTMAKYDISSKEFGKALKFIENNVEFAQNINYTTQYPELSKKSMDAYLTLLRELNYKSTLIATSMHAGDGIDELIESFASESIKRQRALESISKEEIALMTTFVRIGELFEFWSEDFVEMYSVSLNTMHSRDSGLRALTRDGTLALLVKGMERCNQTNYISMLKMFDFCEF